VGRRPKLKHRFELARVVDDPSQRLISMAKIKQLMMQGVVLEALILKPNMVIAGLAATTQNTADEVADATLQCLRRAVQLRSLGR
jgi:fructose-bisphosphate aldolase class 1